MGHDESTSAENRGNFCAYVEELSDIDGNLKVKLQQRYGNYMSPQYQNDLIEKTIVEEVRSA